MQLRQRIEQPHPGRQFGGDRRVQVLHVGQPLDAGLAGEFRNDPEGREPAHDRIEHEALFAQVLLAVLEPVGERRILAGARAARGGSGESLGLEHAIAYADQPLRARTNKAVSTLVADGEA